MSTPNLNTWAARPVVKFPSASKLYGFNLLGIWPLGGLTGTPTISVVTAAPNAPIQTYATGGAVAAGDIVFGAPIVNTGSFKDDNGQPILAGQAVQCQISGGVDGGNYVLQVGATDGTTSDSLLVMLQIRGPGQAKP